MPSHHVLPGKNRSMAQAPGAPSDRLALAGGNRTLDLALDRASLRTYAICPFHEMDAYEALWSRPETTFRSLSEHFARHPGSVPSDFVSKANARECATFTK